MGLIKFLDKAVGKLEEYTPRFIECVEKMQEIEAKKAERYNRDVEIYKKQYSRLSDNELLDEMNRIRTDSTMKSRKEKNAACRALFEERGFEIGTDNKVRRKTI